MLYGEERDEGLGLALLQTMLPHTYPSQKPALTSPLPQPVSVRRWGGKMYDAFERGGGRKKGFLCFLQVVGLGRKLDMQYLYAEGLLQPSLSFTGTDCAGLEMMLKYYYGS